MIVYNVIVFVKKEIEVNWLMWMKEVHIPEVMNTGYFYDWQIQKQILQENDPDEITFSINYMSNSFQDYLEYAEKEAPRLQKLHLDMFNGKFRATRKVYEIINK